MWFERQLEAVLLETAKTFPVLALMGPRQSGKTTLIKALFPDYEYVNLEDPDRRAFAQEDPKGFLQRYIKRVIFDEVQRVPELFSYLQGLVDEDPTPGRFILTGSHQLMLHEKISQSLAGRVALFSLLPLSLQELTAHVSCSVNQCLYRGFYPGLYQQARDPVTAYRSYFQTYVERDVRAIIQLKNLSTFERFVRLCAGRVGQLLNYQSLSQDVGVSPTTIREWISLLTASYILYLLPPYFENIGKRLIKSPKLYFVDVGLASYLLGIEEEKHLEQHPLYGHLFENMMVMDFVKERLHQGKTPHCYFYRDQQGVEIDLVYQQGHQLSLIEIKSALTFHYGALENLIKMRDILGPKVQSTALVYQGTESFHTKEVQVVGIGGVNMAGMRWVNSLCSGS